MNTKLEGNDYPGLVFRRRDNYNNLDFSSRKTSSTNERKFLDYTDGMKVKIYRITNEDTGVQEIFYSINDEEKIKINDLSQFNPEFDLSVWFGAAPTNASATAAQRILVNTTLKDMYIKLGTYHEEESNNYTVTLNPNGGSVSPTSITHEKNVAIGELPSPTAPEGKTFIGWFTGLTDGVEVASTYIPSGNITIYARYYIDITGATVSPSSISILNGSNQTLTVSNVEEQYTFTSNNTAIATVDSSGKVTGTGEGTTTITITGSTSGKTRTINVTVEASTYTVTLNPNGGTVTPTSITQNKNTPIGELPTPTAPVGKVFDAWYTGLTDGVKVTSSYTPNTDIEIYARYTNQEFTVTFDTDGGTAVPSQTISYGSTATRPSTNPTKTNYTFDDWYTDDTYETKYDFDNTVITGDTTIYGNFYYQITKCAANSNRTSLSSDNCQNSENIEIGEGIVCKRAIKLHQEKCYGSSYGCYRSGYYEGGSKNTSTITYGNCGTQGNLSAGDAFTCDINADGKFDELYERFYYVSDYYDTTNQTFDSDTVVLIYYNNVIDGIACNRNYSYSYANIDDIQEVYPTAEHAYNIYGPLTITKLLPKNYQWSNVSLKKENRQILSEDSNNHDKLNTNGGVLPTSYSYSGYAARFLTVKELETNCTNGNDVYTNGVLDNCNFIFENTGYSNSGISGGTWLETPVYSENYYVWRVDSFYRDLTACVGVECGRGARPVIEVPKTKISY